MPEVTERFVPNSAAITGLASFILIGAVQAFYGPSLPAFTSTFELSRGTAGLVVSIHNAGALLGILSAIPLAGRAIARWRVAASIGLLGVGALLVGMSPYWLLLLLGAFFIGFAYGSLTIGLNSLFAAGFGKRSPAMVNLLNAIFGMGAILGPLLILLSPDNPQIAFLILAAACALILPFGLRVDDRIPTETRQQELTSSKSTFFAFLIFFALVIGIEVSTIGYAATFLVATGHTASVAATATSVFFIIYTLARLSGIPLSLKFEPFHVVIGALLIGVGFLSLAHQADFGIYGLVLMGASVAMFFPNCFNWQNQLFHATSLTVFIVMGALFGATIIPALIAWTISIFGETSIVTTLLALQVMALIGALLIRISSRQTTQQTVSDKIGN